MWIPDIKSTGVIQYPCACEIKYDGEFVSWNGVEFRNKREIVKRSVTILPAKFKVYGELYYGEGKEFYSEIHSHQGVDNKVIVFDNDAYGIEPYISRRSWLDRHIEIVSVPYCICYDQREVNNYFEQVSQWGYEGIVIKPLQSLTDRDWIKMKREYSSTLLIRGFRKGRKETIAVGTPDKVLGCCSLLGWDVIKKMIIEEGAQIIKEDSECLYFNSEIKLEIKHNGIIIDSGKLRHPRIKRVRDHAEEIQV